MRFTTDVLIVGSGFGGAVMACRLAQQGLTVLVTEQGRRWAVDDYPRELGDDWIYDPDEPAKQHGWLDFRIFDDMAVAMGAGVGGGSLIYANVSVDAPASSFAAGWPSEITRDELQPYYERVGKVLDSQVLPDNQLTERFKLTFSTLDLERLRLDSSHRGKAEGHVRCEAFGGERPVDSGTIELFTPGDTADSTEARYELSFQESSGRSLALRGAKHIRNERGLEAWTDTPVLYSRIVDVGGAPLAAGIVRVGLLPLLRHSLTFRVRAGTFWSRVFAIPGFLRFFVSSLWQTHSRRLNY